MTVGTLASPRFGALAAIEGDRHILTLGGIRGDYPPTDPAGFADFACALPTSAIAEAVAAAEPLDEPVPFRFPASTRNRYERLREFPAGFLVIGDALCSFNPVYGQGMTVGADLAFPQVPGQRPAKARFVNAYLPRLHAAAADDGELAVAMIRVIGLKDRPEGLIRPDRMLRVLRGNLHRRHLPTASYDLQSESGSPGMSVLK